MKMCLVMVTIIKLTELKMSATAIHTIVWYIKQLDRFNPYFKFTSLE